MKIAIDLTALADNFTGIERFALNIAYNMIKSCPVDDFILLFKREVHNSFKEFSDCDNVRFVVLKECNKLLFTQIILPVCMYKIKADRYLFLAFPAPFIFIRQGTISAIHDIGCWDCPDAMTVRSRYFFRILFRKAALTDYKIITISEFSKARIIDKLKVKKSRITVIYCATEKHFNTDWFQINTIDIHGTYSLPDRYILCLSTLEPRKNMRLLIDACCSLWKDNKLHSDLVLVGRKGWKISNLLDNLDQAYIHRIHLTGFVKDEDLPLIYKNADVFVFPSIYEGFGIPPLEAIECGTAVISSDASSLPEVLGDAAIYFESNNQTALEQQLIAFYFMKSKKNIGKLPRKYDWGLSSQKLRKFLEPPLLTFK